MQLTSPELVKFQKMVTQALLLEYEQVIRMTPSGTELPMPPAKETRPDANALYATLQRIESYLEKAYDSDTNDIRNQRNCYKEFCLLVERHRTIIAKVIARNAS